MRTSANLDHPDHHRPDIDYFAYRERAARMRSEMINDALAKGLSTVTPSRAAVRNLCLALLVATGAFWVVMLKDPPTTVAADPSTSTKALSPLNLKVPVDSPTGDYIPN
jgi:hypothetical protein